MRVQSRKFEDQTEGKFCSVASAMVGSAIIGGVASNMAASTQADAATSASNAQIAAQQQALQFQQQQAAPYTQAGQQALSQYQNQLNGGAASFDVSKLPGYAFQMQQAQQATNNSASATTGALSGNAQIALQDRAQGIASTGYDSYLNRLSGLASMGENAAVGVGNSGANIISSTGNNVASNIIGAGNSAAASQIATGNQVGSVLNNTQVQQSLGQLFGSGNSTVQPTGIQGPPSDLAGSQIGQGL